MIANRTVFGETILALAKEDPRIVVVDADAASCMNVAPLKEACPERYFNCGIAEQNMVSVAAGLATCDLIPFCGSFAVFSSMRALDQLRNGVCYNHFNVKIAGTHAGVETAQDGGTHQSVEDIAIMRAVPGIGVIVPSTPNMTRDLTRRIAYTPGPFYIRMGRGTSPELYDAARAFPIGGSVTLRAGDDVALLACGNMVPVALEAAELLGAAGVQARVLDMYSIKPLDEEAVIAAARQTGGIVTIEDHSVLGGLGGAVCETVAEKAPAPVARVGLPDVFGRSGSAEDLFARFGLTAQNVARVARDLIKK
nr:transketolase C-terminal domain-containing protein [Maliibacterium massiliense]